MRQEILSQLVLELAMSALAGSMAQYEQIYRGKQLVLRTQCSQHVFQGHFPWFHCGALACGLSAR